MKKEPNSGKSAFLFRLISVVFWKKKAKKKYQKTKIKNYFFNLFFFHLKHLI